MPKVEVVNYRPFTGQGSLKGFAEIKVGPLTIRDIRLIQVAGKEAFVAPPQKEYVNREGEKKYIKLVDWPDEWADDIRNAIIQHSHGDQDYEETQQEYAPQQRHAPREEYTPQGGSRQDSYHSDRVAPRPPARRTPAPPPDAYDDELQDPFMD